jgi:hypothetical protein
MGRKRYPSDEPDKRRKQRPHVKIHLSTRNHRKTAGHFGAAEFRGQLLGLFFVAAERFAGKTEGKLHLSRTDIEWISGKRRADVALTSVQRLANIMEYSHELQGDVLVIDIPKFSKKQGYAPQLRSGTPTPSAESASLQRTKEPKNRGTEEPNKSKPPPPAECVELAERLRNAILRIQPTRKVPRNLDPWARTYDKAIRLDHRAPRDLTALQRRRSPSEI